MNRPERPWLRPVFALPLTFAIHSATAVTLFPADDGYTRGGKYADDDYSSQANFIVKNSHNIDYDRKAYLNFDLGGVDAENIDTATLKIFAARIKKNVTLNILLGSDAWSDQISWNTAPAASPDAGFVTATLDPADSNNWIEVDITRLIQKANGQQLSLIIENPTAGRGNGVTFHSIENANAPQLAVTRKTVLNPVAAPAAVRVEHIDGQVVLDWEAPALNTDDLSIAGYRILRKQSTESEYSELVGDSESQSTFFVDNSALPGTSYDYQVAAIAVDTHSAINIDSPFTEAVTLQPFSENSKPVANIVTDANRDGYLNAEDNFGEAVWSSESGAVFGPNLDDDDNDGVADGRDAVPNGEKDLTDMAKIFFAPMNHTLSSDSIQIEFSYEFIEQSEYTPIFDRDDKARHPKFFVYLENQNRWLELGQYYTEKNGTTVTLPLNMSPASISENGLSIYIDSLFGRHPGFDGNIQIVQKIVRNSKVISQDEVAVRGAPVIYSHDLQTPLQAFVTSNWDKNAALYNSMVENTDPSIQVTGIDYPSIWLQDSGQFGYVQKPSANGLETTLIQTVTPSGSNRWLKFLDSEKGYIDFSGIYTSKFDSGGNIEVIPPYTHNGVSYPFGRLVVGGRVDKSVPTLSANNTNREIAGAMMDFFISQEIQGPPIVLPSAWLTVGHIDEMFKFLPNPNAGPGERPWVVAIAAPAKGIEVKDIGGLEEVNRNIQEHIIDKIKQVFKDEIGLIDDDFVDVPLIYSSAGSTRYPNVINMQAVGTDLYIPDPEASRFGEPDLYKQAAIDALEKLGYTLHFLPVKAAYFAGNGGGGIHCGTNVEYDAVRDIPWWTADK